MTAPTPNAELAYRVTFDRIGRNHNAPELLATADGPNHLADLILKHARPHLGSRFVDVVFEEDMGSGWIFCGMRTGGTFKIEVVEIFGPRPVDWNKPLEPVMGVPPSGCDCSIDGGHGLAPWPDRSAPHAKDCPAYRPAEEMQPPPCADHAASELACRVCTAQRRAFYAALGRDIGGES